MSKMPTATAIANLASPDEPNGGIEPMVYQI
jgi:hypothetical protein